VTDVTAQEKLPYNLIPTNLNGVSSFVPPPKGTDLTKADRGTLLKHGLWMRRPDPDREPKLFAMWHRYVTEIWTEENFVPPVFEVTKDTPHNLRGGRRQTDGSYTSFNWSGVVVVGQWVGAMGMWQIPKVWKPNTPAGPSKVWQSSSWVGLDGAGGLIPGTTTTDVLQTGISQNVGPLPFLKEPQPTYYAWYEWFVTDYESVSDQFPYVYPVNITSPRVHPGNEISAIVQYVKHQDDDPANPLPPAGPYHFGAVMLTDVTSGKPICNLALKPPTGATFTGDSAEWIMECGSQTMPSFSSVTFRSAGACNVNDAPPEANVGVDLGKAPQVNFLGLDGVETSVTAGLATVTITYMDT
jgi:hypothetical protein